MGRAHWALYRGSGWLIILWEKSVSLFRCCGKVLVQGSCPGVLLGGPTEWTWALPPVGCAELGMVAVPSSPSPGPLVPSLILAAAQQSVS